MFEMLDYHSDMLEPYWMLRCRSRRSERDGRVGLVDWTAIHPARRISSTPRSKFGPQRRSAQMGPIFFAIEKSRLGLKRQFRRGSVALRTAAQRIAMDCSTP